MVLEQRQLRLFPLGMLDRGLPINHQQNPKFLYLTPLHLLQYDIYATLS